MPLKHPFAPLRSLGFIALFTMALIVMVQYGVAWYGLEVVKVSKENEFNRHLADVGKIAQPLLRGSAIDIAEIAVQVPDESANGNDPAVEAGRFLQQLDRGTTEPFYELAERARLNGLTLLDTKGRVLLSTADPERVLVPFEFLEIDRDKFESALVGQIAESLSYSVGADPLKRIYVPIRDVDRESVAAVLCLTAGPDYLGALNRLGKNMRVLSLISTALVCVIGLIVYRLLVRQRRYEQQAEHADRLKSLGSLAAGFAHEVRNPLEIIGACTEDLQHTLRDATAGPPDALEACGDILEEVDRLNRLVGQFLQYSRADSARDGSETAPALRTVDSAVSMLRHAAEKQGVSIVWRPTSNWSDGEDVQVTLGDGSLRQVVVNLVMNAIQATPNGGRVELMPETTPKFFRLSVHDTGPGIPPASRPHIFDPFFTTREEGSGLGLSIAHQLVERAGGRITCEERPLGAGACFIVEIPRVAGPARSAASPLPQATRKEASGELV